MVELRKKEYSGYSLALCHSISVNTTQYHLFSSLSRFCESLSGNKVEVFVFVPILGAVLSSIMYWRVTIEQNFLFSWLLVTHLLGTNVSSLASTRAAFDVCKFDLMCSSEMSKVFRN